MKILINSNKLADQLDDEKLTIKTFGKNMSDKIHLRLAQLHAANSLEDMRNFGRCHELKGVLAGHFAVDLVHPFRLIFRPDTKNKDYLEDNHINWKKVISVEIIKIEDYH